MSKRDNEYTQELKKLESVVLQKYIQLKRERGETQEYNILSLNSTINSRIICFAKIKELSYTTAEQLLDVYCGELSELKDDIIYEFLRDEDCWKYFEIYIRRYFVRKEKELSRNKPKQKMYELWFGDNYNCYGIMITPVFRYSYQHNMNIWENDKSEIRKVDFKYWSVSHILKTGLIDLERNELISFVDIEDLIDFYKRVFFARSKSKYEKMIMIKYFELLRKLTDYDKVAFLIPELRLKKEEQHKYRLDFTALCTGEVEKYIGFELSPDSTHAFTQNIEQKSSHEIIREEIKRWEKEIGKRNEYYEEFEIHVRTFMEKELQDIDKCFEIIKSYICYEGDKKVSWKDFRYKLQNNTV